MVNNKPKGEEKEKINGTKKDAVIFKDEIIEKEFKHDPKIVRRIKEMEKGLNRKNLNN
jgi:hypothetical protein